MFPCPVPTLSVIFPTWNEAESIRASLESFLAFGVEQVRVVDGGSTDRTRERVIGGPGPSGTAANDEGPGPDVEWIACPERGRARQMNLGAIGAKGDLLLFCHADTQIPRASLQNLIRTFDRTPDLVGGGFRRRFAGGNPFLAISSRLSDLRGRFLGWFLGDQGIFVRRPVFESLGGFDESLEIGEDLDFSYRLRRFGPTVAIGPPAISSARRFAERGAVRQTLRDFVAARRILADSKARIAP